MATILGKIIIQQHSKLLTPQWFQYSENQRPKLWGSVIWNFLYDIYLQNGSHFLFFHNGQCQYSISQMQIFHWFSFPITTPLHPGSVSTFKPDDVSMLKTFMCGHSCVMTFLHLKVHNGWCKFSIGLVFQIFHWFSFTHQCIIDLVSIFKGGYALNIHVWWPLCSLPTSHLYVVLHFLIFDLLHFYLCASNATTLTLHCMQLIFHKNYKS